MSLILGEHPKVEPRTPEDGGVVIQHGEYDFEEEKKVRLAVSFSHFLTSFFYLRLRPSLPIHH